MSLESHQVRQGNRVKHGDYEGEILATIDSNVGQLVLLKEGDSVNVVATAELVVDGEYVEKDTGDESASDSTGGVGTTPPTTSGEQAPPLER